MKKILLLMLLICSTFALKAQVGRFYRYNRYSEWPSKNLLSGQMGFDKFGRAKFNDTTITQAWNTIPWNVPKSFSFQSIPNFRDSIEHIVSNADLMLIGKGLYRYNPSSSASEALPKVIVEAGKRAEMLNGQQVYNVSFSDNDTIKSTHFPGGYSQYNFLVDASANDSLLVYIDQNAVPIGTTFNVVKTDFTDVPIFFKEVGSLNIASADTNFYGDFELSKGGGAVTFYNPSSQNTIYAAGAFRVPTELDYTGWEDYSETGNYISIANGDSAVFFVSPTSSVTSQTPIDLIAKGETLYNVADSVITGRYGDGISITLEMIVVPTSSATDTRVRWAIDIGGAIGVIYQMEQTLTKGNGALHYVLSTTNAYTLDTWEANGGKIWIWATNGPIQIQSRRIVIHRVHKGRQ